MGYELTDFQGDFLSGLSKSVLDSNLEKVKCLMGMIGNPHRSLKVIHIGGTNGKGSTAAMVAKILESAGYRVGLFTSPHLHSYTERYLINGVPISEERFAGLLARVRPSLEQMADMGYGLPTKLGVCVAIGFLYFSEENVDFLVLEVGLGGATDSTNIVENPLVSVVTNVTLDHTDLLGSTVKEIAAVKAGIIKRNGYAVTAASDQDALAVIEARCRKVGASLFKVGTDITYEVEEATPYGTVFSLYSKGGNYPCLRVPLVGRHQAVNAATALGAVEVLRHYHGVRVTQEQIRAGFAGTKWPGRLELLTERPMVLVDVAHNHDGAKKLRDALLTVYRYRRLVLVLGMLEDKEREKVVEELVPLASVVVVTKPDSPRAGNWRAVAADAYRYVERVLEVEEVFDAIDAALGEAGVDDLVCITGSFHVVSKARVCLMKEFSVRLGRVSVPLYRTVSNILRKP